MNRLVITSEAEKRRHEIAMEKGREYVKKESERLGRPLFCAIVTFGCQMNARDSEKMSGILVEMGYELIEDEEAADFVLFNTCTVRENADNHLYGRLGRVGAFKKKRPHIRVAVCGCMMQEEAAVEKLRKSYAFVDIIFGTFNIHRFADLIVTMHESDRMVVDIWNEAKEITEDLPAVRKYPFKSGVNIMYGCDNYCTFCIVPYVRGRERSRASKDIIDEVKRLAYDGVKEVMLLGQNVNSYGFGLEKEISFPELLQRVCDVDGIERVRYMSSNPHDFSDELIEVMRTEKKAARHIHLALQSGSDRILKMMNRKHTGKDFLRIVDKIHEADPDISITTDIIVGFPTETDRDVDDTIDIIKKAGFDNAFTFIYSKRSGTPAANFPMEADKGEIQRNFDRVLKAVHEQARERTFRFEGRDMRVLVEGTDLDDESLLTGRLSTNALVHFKGEKELIGSFTDVHLDKSHGFYYSGHRIDRT